MKKKDPVINHFLMFNTINSIIDILGPPDHINYNVTKSEERHTEERELS